MTFIDRPQIAAEQLLNMDPKGAALALLDPEGLSPTQLGIADEEGNWKPKDDGPMSVALRTVTNPLLIMGLVMSRGWPIKKAGELLAHMSDYSKLPAISSMLAKLRSFGGIFAGTEFKEQVNAAMETIYEKRQSWWSTLVDGVRESKKLGPLTARRDIAAGALLDGLANSDHASWGIVRGKARQMAYQQRYGDEWVELAREKGDATIEAWSAKIGGLDGARLLATAPAGLVKGSRKMLTDIAQSMVGDAEVAGNVRSRLQAIMNYLETHGIAVLQPDGTHIFQTQAFSAAAKARVAGETVGFDIASYFPHQALRGDQASFRQYLARFIEEGGEHADLERLTAAARPRASQMLPSLEDLGQLSDMMGAETRQALTMLGQNAEVRLPMMQYSLRATGTLERYAHSMAKSYALTGRGYGPRIQQEVMKLVATEAGGKVRANLAKEVYLPIILGDLTPEEAVYALEWGHGKASAYSWLKSAKADWVPERLRGFLTTQLERPEIQGLTWKNAGVKLSNWFYLSTLGANPVSPVLNLTQNLMTTSAVVGPKHLQTGFMKAAGRVSEYASLRGAGLDAEQAMAKAFPHVHHIYDSAETEIRALLEEAKYGATGPMAKGWGKFKKGLMMPFTASERFNKLWSFESALAKAQADGLGGDMAIKYAKEVMSMSQFPGGPFGAPSGLVHTWAPFRQFLQFPLRTLEMATRDPGTAGRMMAAGVMTYGAGQMAGLDLSRGTVFGALPTPYSEDQPFYPFPLVPPAVSIGGAVASDLFSGKWEKTPRALPLMVPGGVALSRAATVAAPGMAQKIGRPYADYTHPRPDGTVAIYSSEGNLIGFKRPIDLFNDAVGWTNFNGQTITDLERYLVKQRDKIRDHRRQYVEAIASNDFRSAEAIQTEWKRLYPGMGDLVVKQQDIQAIHMRHDVSRAERILQTMPTETREQYAGLLTAALANTSESFMGVDPALLGQPTVGARDAGRVVPGMGPRAQLLQHQRQVGQSGVPGLQPQAILGKGGGLRVDMAGEKPDSGPFGRFDGFGEW